MFARQSPYHSATSLVLKVLFYVFYTHFIFIYVYVNVSVGARGGQKRVSVYLNLELQAAVSHVHAGTKLWSSERAAGILDYTMSRNYHANLAFFSLTRSHCIDQAVLKLTEVSLPLPPKLWGLKAGFLLLMRILS